MVVVKSSRLLYQNYEYYIDFNISSTIKCVEDKNNVRYLHNIGNIANIGTIVQNMNKYMIELIPAARFCF